MKILKLFIGCFIAIIIGFLLIGFIIPTVTYETRVEVNQTVEETFKEFNDSAKMRTWIPGLSEIKMVEGKWNDIGSKYLMIIRQDDKTFNMYETLTGFVPGKVYAYDLENDVMTSQIEIRFMQKNPGTTEIITKNKVRGKNMFWRSMFPFFKRYFKKNDQEIYTAFKTMVEKDIS